MMELIQVLQNNAPMVVIASLGFWRVLVAVHKLEIRLVRLESKKRCNSQEN